MATTPHIWLLWWQTSMHLQSHADLRTFLTRWRKALTMESCLFGKLANKEPVLGATCTMSLCQGLYYMSRERALWTKTGSDLSKASMQLFWDHNHTHNTSTRCCMTSTSPLNNGNDGFGEKGLKEFYIILNSFLLTKGHFCLDLVRSEIVSHNFEMSKALRAYLSK